MLKRTLKFAAALLSASILLAACGGMNDAQAAQYPDNYVTSNNRVVSVENASYVDLSGTALIVTYTTGQQSGNGAQDVGGVVFNKMLLSGKFIKVSPTRLVQPSKAVLTYCDAAAGKTTFAWENLNANTIVNDPGCVIFDALKANSN